MLSACEKATPVKSHWRGQALNRVLRTALHIISERISDRQPRSKRCCQPAKKLRQSSHTGEDRRLTGCCALRCTSFQTGSANGSPGLRDVVRLRKSYASQVTLARTGA